MRSRSVAFVPVLVVVLAACSGTGATPSLSGSAASPAAASPAAQTVEVTLTDTLLMEPAELTVKAGQPVTFVITNSGAIEHEFYLGDEAMQGELEAQMQSGEMMHDTPEGVVVQPGETVEFTYTFADPGQTLAGCHVAGHYAAGMKAAITVTE